MIDLLVANFRVVLFAIRSVLEHRALVVRRQPDCDAGGAIDSLLAAVEEKDRVLAAAMRAKLEILRNFMRGNENPHPYECVTHFLIHAFTLLAPPMSDNTLQLWVYIMHHPEFRIADVPTSAYKIRAFNKLFPSVEPGNVLSTAFVDAK